MVVGKAANSGEPVPEHPIYLGFPKGMEQRESIE